MRSQEREIGFIPESDQFENEALVRTLVFTMKESRLPERAIAEGVLTRRNYLRGFLAAQTRMSDAALEKWFGEKVIGEYEGPSKPKMAALDGMRAAIRLGSTGRAGATVDIIEDNCKNDLRNKRGENHFKRELSSSPPTPRPIHYSRF